MAIRKSRKKTATNRRPAAPARKKTSSRSARPIGLDLGTSTVVVARPNGRGVRASSELNAFIELPKSGFTEQILDQNRIDFVRENGHTSSRIRRNIAAFGTRYGVSTPFGFDGCPRRGMGI